MTNLPSIKSNSLETPGSQDKQFEKYSTLKKSLSGSLNDKLSFPSKLLEGPLDGQQDGEVLSPLSNLSSPLGIDIPKTPGVAQAALAALQTLPTPLLVLSSSKTIVLANDAIGRLLGLDSLDDSQLLFTNGGYEETATLDMLQGQSLSQLGIDMVQDGQQIWVSWEV